MGTVSLLPLGDLSRLTLGWILVQSWLSSSAVCSTISWYIFMERMSWLSEKTTVKGFPDLRCMMGKLYGVKYTYLSLCLSIVSISKGFIARQAAT